MNKDLEAWLTFLAILVLIMLVFYFALKTGFGNADKFNNLIVMLGGKGI
jgi:preprotein translocase subunit YajC